MLYCFAMKTLFETKRLKIRDWQKGDAADLFELSNTDIYEFIEAYGWKPIKTKKDAEAIIEAWTKGEKHPLCPSQKLQYAIALKTGKVIGTLGLSERESDAIQVGFIFNSNSKGKGYATEMLIGLIAHNDARGIKTVAYTSEGNHAAARVMEKSGMKYQCEDRLPDMPFVRFVVYSV